VPLEVELLVRYAHWLLEGGHDLIETVLQQGRAMDIIRPSTRNFHEAFSWMANHPNRPAIAIKMPHPIRITPTGRNCPKYPAKATEMRLTPDMLVSTTACTRPIISFGVAARSSGPKATGMPPCGMDMRKQMISPATYQLWKE